MTVSKIAKPHAVGMSPKESFTMPAATRRSDSYEPQQAMATPHATGSQPTRSSTVPASRKSSTPAMPARGPYLSVACPMAVVSTAAPSAASEAYTPSAP